MGLQIFAWGPLLVDVLRPLPTADPECLAAITLLALANAKFGIHECNDPLLSATGRLPVLQDEASLFHGLDAIFERKSERLAHLDAFLTSTMRADTVAIRSMVQGKMLDILNFMWFVHPHNQRITSKRFRELMALLPRWRHLREMRRLTVGRLNRCRDWTETSGVESGGISRQSPGANRNPSSHFSSSTDLLQSSSQGMVFNFDEEPCTWTEQEVLNAARQMYRTLEQILGDSDYIFGDAPSSLDAIVFGHLALHYFVQFPGDCVHPQHRMSGPQRQHASPPHVLSDDTSEASKAAPVVNGDDQSRPTLSSLLHDEFPVVVAYIERVYERAHIESHTHSMHRAKVSLFRLLKESGKSISDALIPSTKSFWRSDAMQFVTTFGAGLVLLAGYLWFVRGSEEQRLVDALQQARAAQLLRKRMRKQRIGDKAEEDGDEDGNEDEEEGDDQGELKMVDEDDEMVTDDE